LALLAQRSDIEIVFPVHRNPRVLEPAHRILTGRRNIHLIDPMDYTPFIDLLSRSYLVLTDSGGIQEEAPSLGKPVLVLRENTERPEAVEAGSAKLVGTDPERILAETYRLLDDSNRYRHMACRRNPFGDGRACERIAAVMEEYAGRQHASSEQTAHA
jgi:UDP-N-acetylglucosamine 2-epimerase